LLCAIEFIICYFSGTRQSILLLSVLNNTNGKEKSQAKDVFVVCYAACYAHGKDMCRTWQMEAHGKYMTCLPSALMGTWQNEMIVVCFTFFCHVPHVMHMTNYLKKIYSPLLTFSTIHILYMVFHIKFWFFFCLFAIFTSFTSLNIFVPVQSNLNCKCFK